MRFISGKSRRIAFRIFRVLAWTLGIVLGLLLVLALLIQVPAIQNRIKQHAVTFLSEKIGTRVALDHVSLSIPKKLVLEGIYLEDQKRTVTSRINRILGSGGIANEQMLRGHNIIVVADGLPSGASLDAVADFMKPIRIKRLIVVTPVASVDAVDRMHIFGDELHVLGVTDNFMGVNHYYEDNAIPDHDQVVRIINDAILAWR